MISTKLKVFKGFKGSPRGHVTYEPNSGELKSMCIIIMIKLLSDEFARSILKVTDKKKKKRPTGHDSLT